MSKSNLYTRLHTIFSPTRNAANSINKSKQLTNPIPKPTKTPKISTPDNNQAIDRGIRDLLNEKDSQKLVEKFKSLSKISYFRNKYKLYDFTIHRLSIAKQYPLIEEVLESQKNFISGDGFAARIIYLYGKAGMFEHAHKVFDELSERNFEERFKSFRALLGAACNAEKYDKVYELFRELPSKLSIKPSSDCYNTAAHAFCKLGLIDDAVALLDEMEEKGLKPDVVTFNTLLWVYYEKGEFEKGEKMWERMIKSGVVPDIKSYDFKLQGLVNDGKQSEAMELVKELESKGIKPDTGTYNALIRGSCKEDDLDGVRKWYSELLNRGCIPNRVTFSSIVPFLCDKGDYGLAFQVCKKMFRRHCSVDESLLQKVVDGLAKNKMIEEAEILVGLGKSNTFHPYDLVLPKQGLMGIFD